MFIRKYWIPLLVFIIAIVGVGLYVLQTRPPKDPIVIVKPVEYEKPPAKAPIVDQPEQVGHVHEDGTFHADTPAPVATPTRIGELTYHADLLASHPVEALRALAEELGHWSAEWIPPYPPDDHRAAALARAAYHVAYDKATGLHWQTQTFQQHSTVFSRQLAALRNMEYSTERSDLSKLTWIIGSRGSVGDPSKWRTNFELPVR